MSKWDDYLNEKDGEGDMPPDPTNVLSVEGHIFHEALLATIAAGFTRAEAFELIKIMYKEHTRINGAQIERNRG